MTRRHHRLDREIPGHRDRAVGLAGDGDHREVGLGLVDDDLGAAGLGGAGGDPGLDDGEVFLGELVALGGHVGLFGP